MKGWRTVSLGDFADSVDYGVTASATQQPSGPKFLRITDIQNGEVNWSTVPWCECDARSAANSRLKLGDIVFARTGATTGKSFLIRECPEDAVFASYLIRVRVGDSVEPCYLSHFFNSPDYWAQITQSARGVAQPGVNASTLKTLKIPLPPLPEQKRIAAILDKADSIRRKRQEAVRLTEELLRSVFLDMFGDPVTNPMGWPIKRLGDVVGIPLQNGAYYPSDLYCENNSEGVQMVHMSDAFYGSVERGKLKRVRASVKDIKKYGLSDTDILVARRSLNYEGSVKPCMIPSGGDGLIFESSLIRVNPDPNKLLPIYLYHFLNDTKAKSEYVLPYVTKSTISGINQKNLERVEIVVPDLDKQKQFEQFFKMTESFAVKTQQHLSYSENLFNALLQNAFKGAL